MVFSYLEIQNQQSLKKISFLPVSLKFLRNQTIYTVGLKSHLILIIGLLSALNLGVNDTEKTLVGRRIVARVRNRRAQRELLGGEVGVVYGGDNGGVVVSLAANESGG